LIEHELQLYCIAECGKFLSATFIGSGESSGESEHVFGPPHDAAAEEAPPPPLEPQQHLAAAAAAANAAAKKASKKTRKQQVDALMERDEPVQVEALEATAPGFNTCLYNVSHS